MFGALYAKQTVHDQLVAQKIYFPADAKSGLLPGLEKYAGQQVDDGDKAKVFADKYIAVHLSKVANGQTYSEVSAAFLKDKTNATLAGQRETLFMGETLRGLLLNAWGWGLIGTIAYWSSIGLLSVAVLLVMLLGVTGLFAPTSKKKSRAR